MWSSGSGTVSNKLIYGILRLSPSKHSRMRCPAFSCIIQKVTCESRTGAIYGLVDMFLSLSSTYHVHANSDPLQRGLIAYQVAAGNAVGFYITPIAYPTPMASSAIKSIFYGCALNRHVLGFWFLYFHNPSSHKSTGPMHCVQCSASRLLHYWRPGPSTRGRTSTTGDT